MRIRRPPALADKFLLWFCKPELLEEIQGDLHAHFERNHQEDGSLKSRLKYWVQVLQFIRPFAIKSNWSNSNYISMYIHYFKVAFRHLARTKLYTFLNIVGLAIGMACSMLILLWVENELSYDRFNHDAENIYRLTGHVNDFKAAVTPAGMGPDLQEMLPEIESVVRVSKFNNGLFETNNQIFEEDRILMADSNFFDFFNFKLLLGDQSSALANPNTIVMTSGMAKKYFGNDDPIGKIFKVNNTYDVSVVAILEDLPSNSHLKFDFLIPLSTVAKTDQDLVTKTWDNFTYYNYFKLNYNLNSPESISTLEEKITAIYWDRQESNSINFKLQPLTDIHLKSDLQIDLAEKGNMQYVTIFFMAALFILGIACINFMNLSTARSIKRSKEVALRKTIGAQRKQLIGQFLSESILLTIISSALAMLLVIVALPHFNTISGKELSIDFLESSFWIRFLLIIMATGLISGSYPALFLSSFNPLKVMKGELKHSFGNIAFRNILVITQFTISGILIVGTLVVYNQLNFIKGMNLGFNKENLITIPLRRELRDKLKTLQNTLGQNPFTEEYSIISDLPYDLTTGVVNVQWDGKPENVNIVIPNINIDDNFLDLFEIKILAGKGFHKDLRSDEDSFIINETMMNLMGKDLRSILGEKISYNGPKGRVIGVVEDFNFKPLQYEIQPIVLRKRLPGCSYYGWTNPGLPGLTGTNTSRAKPKISIFLPFP
ncbi:ABC transporter permease [Reichenbachiella sp. MALMAid0571]|uniref:ABC transporter permease n=1 Tax=Reichenbachiella sp. MALMAid0571 TaxID=3143939 RepID=UPI0032DF5347